MWINTVNGWRLIHTEIPPSPFAEYQYLPPWHQHYDRTKDPRYEKQHG